MSCLYRSSLAILFVAILGLQASRAEIRGFTIPVTEESFITFGLAGKDPEFQIGGARMLAYDKESRIAKVGTVVIAYHEDGSIAKVGSTVIDYDRESRVRRIGSHPVNYDRYGRLSRIGAATIQYTREGRVALINGEVPAGIRLSLTPPY